MKILLIEDNPGDARLLHEMFSEQNSCDAEVTDVKSIGEAEKYLADHIVDIMVLDLGLPDAHGLGALRRAHAAAPHVPVVVLTGLNDESLAVQALQKGAQDYLVKGRIETHGLMQALRYAVERKIMEVSISNDVIELKRTEVELRESELMLRLALDVSEQGVWRWEVGQDTDRFEWDARCKSLFGLASDAAVSYAVWSCAIAPEDRVAAEAGITRALDPADTFDDYICEYRAVHPDGVVLWLAAKGRAVFEPDLTLYGRRVVRILGTIRDVSQAKRAGYEREAHQRELERTNVELERLSRQLVQARNTAQGANRAKSRFLAGMSHELRTPLNGILGYAHLLRMEGGLSATQAVRVDAMLGAGTHLLQMINSVLDLSEIEAEHVELRKAKFEVQTVLVACLDLVRPAAEAKGLVLTLVVAPGARWELVTDATRLRQMLLNLLGNAVKFTSRGSVELRLRPTEDNTALRIEVVDTGPGIPTEKRQRLFRDFERLETEAARTAEGAGLGLALSAGLATLMGGRLGHDDNPGGGSVFWLELPLDVGSAPLPPAAQAADVPDAEQVSARVLNVLVVDDIAMNCDIAGSFLRRAGHNVVCVESGAEAVEAVAVTDFDVVLMDVRMPGMDGLEATRRIRALEGSRGQVPIVAATAQVFTEQVDECRKAGMNSHLAKPFDPDTLLAAVAHASAARLTQDQSAAMPATTPRASVICSIGAELPVLDLRAFERTAALLAPELVISHLKILAGRVEALLGELGGADVLIRTRVELAPAAQTLAGSAGMYGFERLATLGRRFGLAVQSGAAEAPALADGLSAALEATLPEIRDRTLVGNYSPPSSGSWGSLLDTATSASPIGAG